MVIQAIHLSLGGLKELILLPPSDIHMKVGLYCFDRTNEFEIHKAIKVYRPTRINTQAGNRAVFQFLQSKLTHILVYVFFMM